MAAATPTPLVAATSACCVAEGGSGVVGRGTTTSQVTGVGGRQPRKHAGSASSGCEAVGRFGNRYSSVEAFSPSPHRGAAIKHRVGEDTLWSLDHPPSRKQLGVRWWAFWVVAVLRIVLGGLCCGIALSFAIIVDEPLDLPQFLSAYLAVIRITGAITGSLHGIVSFSGGVITCWMLARYSVRRPTEYKLEIVSTRCQLLVGLILAGVLCLPVGGINDQFCGARLVDRSDFEGRAAAEDVCVHLPLAAALLGTSIATALLNAVIALWGFHLYFGLYASLAYLRFGVSAFASGLTWLCLGIFQATKRCDYYSMLYGDAQKQVDIYYMLLVVDGLLAVIFTAASAVYSLFACWRRSRLFIAVDIAVTFVVFWFQAAACASVLWTSKLSSFFGDIDKYTEFDATPMTQGIGNDGALLGKFYGMLFSMLVLTIVVFGLAIAAFTCFNPREWARPHRRRPKASEG